MKSVYEVFQAQGDRHMKLVGAIQTEQPCSENLLRDVDTKWGRGGFIHVPKVGTDRSCNKASLFITCKDTKVDTLNKSGDLEYGWTCIKIANYESGRGWVRNNPVWSMVLNKEQFQALVAMGAVDPNSDPRKAVTVDFRRATLFPEVVDLNGFYDAKLEQVRREVKFDALESLRKSARKWFKDNGVEIPGYVARHYEPRLDLETVYAFYTAYTVSLPNDVVEVAIDETKYRTNISQNKRPKYEYSIEKYLVLEADYQAAKAAMKEHASDIRVQELALLEQFDGNPVECDRGPISFDLQIRTETFRAKPDEVERFKASNSHRIADAPIKKERKTTTV